jgi:hypothetical protein
VIFWGAFVPIYALVKVVETKNHLPLKNIAFVAHQFVVEQLNNQILASVF